MTDGGSRLRLSDSSCRHMPAPSLPNFVCLSLVQRCLVAVLLTLSTSAWAGILSFTAGPTTFLPGQEVTLAWNVTPGDVISINQGIGPVTGATGNVKVIPAGPTTYILTNTTSGTSAQAVVTPRGVPV